MKAACVTVIFTVVLYISSFSQKNAQETLQKSFLDIHSKEAQRLLSNLHLPSKANGSLIQGNNLQAAALDNPGALKSRIRDYHNKILPARISNNYPGEKLQGNNQCNDSSFVRLFNAVGSTLYMNTITSTADGGILLPAVLLDTTKINFTYRTYSVLLKIDADGNLVWIKEFDNGDAGILSVFNMYNAVELPNKNIICVASIDTTLSFNAVSTVVMQLDKDGNLIWQTGLHTNLVGSPPLVPIFIKSVVEGLNGDIILGGFTDSYGSGEQEQTIIRLNSSGGLVWDANYGNQGSYKFGAEGYGVFMQNGKLIELGISYGTNNPLTSPAICILTLDYNSGNLLEKHFFRPDYPDINVQISKAFTYTYFTNACTRLSNGDFIIYGKLFSDYYNNTPVIDHFGVVEFSPSFNLVKAYTISSTHSTTYGNDLLYIDKSGKACLALFESLNSSGGKVDFASYENGRFLNQRTYNYVADNIGLAGFAFSNDSGFIYSQSYDVGASKNAIEFRKMHNSDTSSACLGVATSFLQFLPLQIIEDPSYAYLDTNISNKLQAQHFNIIENDTIKLFSADLCKQITYCDTVKIHGNPVICGSQPSILFTAYKNPSCGGIVQWNIDSAGIDSMQVLTDTSVLIHFRNVNWKGWLNAMLPVGKCIIPAMDSMEITIISLQHSIDLGADTNLCKGNVFVLHAGNAFSNYQWQDGSTDSTFNVTSPGKYYVSAIDACGNHFSDTILVTAANFPFSIGADTMRCNNDSIHLNATGGFVNYQWQPHYFISADTGRTVGVVPPADTFYIASAQKSPGCTVRDTINIKVFTSPSIHLGKDTSLCAGQSLTLDAGNGFNSYVWNNGDLGQQVTVNQKGTYVIRATALNSCTSSDTIQILNVAPVPFFTLGNDTIVCRNTIYTYNFNFPSATYLWNDGSNSIPYSISQPGTFWLSVTEQGCTARDTVIISYKNNPSVYLGNDSTICEGDNWLLNAAYSNATYLWQDGSALPVFLVTRSGSYYVAVNLNGCFAKDTVQVNYLDKPMFTLGRDTVICRGEAIVLQPRLTSPANYLWQDGSSHPVYSVRDTGVYRLVVSNRCGSFSDDIKIKPGLCALMLPTAFTPNRDGVNDLFGLKYPFAVKAFRFTIYNRFGEKVFETADMGKGWDGTYKNVDQPIGSYVWVIELTAINNIAQTSKGVVTLIK